MQRPNLAHKSGVYQIRNLENGKRYIGSSIRLRTRFAEHLTRLNQQTHPCRYLRSSWRKYSAETFAFEVLLYCEPKDAVWFEQQAIDALNPEYNTCRVAGSTLGTKRTEEDKAKMRQARAGFKPSPEHLENMRAASALRRGVKRPPRTPEWSANQSKSMKGRKVTFSEEHKKNLSQALLGNNRWLGKKHSAETRKKISLAQVGGGRFSDQEVLEIRKLAVEKWTHAQIAWCYGVSRRLVGMIAAKKAYAWVTEQNENT
jgi:group I intron endonuclease